MNEWVLILTMMMGTDSYPRAATIEAVAVTFASEEACLAAGQKWGAGVVKSAPPGTKMTATCVRRGAKP